MFAPGVVQQLVLMTSEALFVAVLLATAFRLRPTLGLAFVYIVFGIIYQVAALLAGSMFVQLSPSLVMSPGSIVLFPATLFLVLYVYLRDDALEARKLIYGVAAANVIFIPLGLMIGAQLTQPDIVNPFHLTPDFFATQPRLAISSTVVLFLDTLLVCVLYEFVSRYTRLMFVRILVPLLATLFFDSIAFTTGSFAGQPFYVSVMISQLVGKTFAGLVYAIVLTAYFQFFSETERPVVGGSKGMRATFRVLTYRQRYEELKKLVVRDPLTGVYNRGFFDEAIAKYVSMSDRSGQPICMMMIDVDHFKRVNDSYGHADGDRVLKIIATAIASCLRVSDYVCRYGGEEFAVLLPHTALGQATVLAQRVRAEIPLACNSGDWNGSRSMPITATIGVAEFPGNAIDGDELVRIADRCLYEGKGAGRDCVVSSDRKGLPKNRPLA